ncbi:glucans biosynthesis glucosyltransferase MdoH [Sphaerotilus uruguayifluvii]|uniref:Glucans biosynthesis glucosyltransferase H n=1 Tax=Sphaerotilus uruguayifluvii TaxID=2735897 RepID=A0ABX2G5N3_9BURK|nr:glucans biosynthesis glucosyltransferase MdoH [Leptothrix sp. C29]NRT57643.1 membrane glycosyltransferase [Leptothrix sp. C29]
MKKHFRASAMPALVRGHMTPQPWQGWRARRAGPTHGPRDEAPPPRWQAAARRRRGALGLAMLAVTLLALGLQWSQHPPAEMSAAELVRSALLALLFAWVSAGFVTALMGWRRLLAGDAQALSAPAGTLPDPAARTAIVMPICNEDVDSVFAGLRATAESLALTGRGAGFEFFVLSDTRDAGLLADEQQAWQRLAAHAREHDLPPVHYRWRRRRSGRKAGNVADFCRRWGRAFRYMVVLDADSVMSGRCLTRLVELMEAHPQVGIAQTAPVGCGHQSLHARAQQYASRVLGRLYVHGLQFWQLGDSHYWGHNAILRVEPFMKHCALARLPGRGGLSGEILSHDFVEAALMRRAGFEVWLVPELDGSYEQLPGDLLDELQRDRRWCQGNLQNARLIAEPGLRPVHRALFATGAMSYLSAPLWLAYVVLGLVDGRALQPGAGAEVGTVGLWLMTGVMLLLPRLLGVLAVWQRGETAAFGGRRALLGGALLEALLATLQAPVRMVAHTLFVLVALAGWKLEWKSPLRQSHHVGWREAWQRLGPWTLGATALTAVLALAEPAMALRLALLTVPLMLAVPLVVATSHAAPGRWLGRLGLWHVPQEQRPPRVLRRSAGLQGLRLSSALRTLPRHAAGALGTPLPRRAAYGLSRLPALALGLPMLAVALGTPATSELPRPAPAPVLMPEPAPVVSAQIGAAAELRRLDLAMMKDGSRPRRPARRHRAG